MNDHALRFDRSYREELTLADGQRVSIRLLQPTDKLRLRQGMARMSSESRYMRFMTSRGDLNEAELRTLTELDGVDHFAIGAVAIHADGTEDGMAVARFVEPDMFSEYEGIARDLGFLAVACGPFVRSSYQAAELAESPAA